MFQGDSRGVPGAPWTDPGPGVILIRWPILLEVMGVRLPTHLSKKEIRRLRRVGHSFQEIADVLGTSKTHVLRISNGYRCRCGACPRPRKLDELLALTPKPRAKPPAEDDGEIDVLGVLTQVLRAAQATQDDGKKTPPPQTGW